MQEESEIRRNRDKFVAEVRKHNRDQLFLTSRKRTADRQKEAPALIVVDPRFQELVQRYCRPHSARPQPNTTPLRWASTALRWSRRRWRAGTRR